MSCSHRPQFQLFTDIHKVAQYIRFYNSLGGAQNISCISGQAHYLALCIDAPGGGPRVVVSTAAFHARVRGSVSAVSKKQKCFFPIHVWKSVLGISNPVSGGQCHLIHLIILRRFSWPSLAYMCTGGQKSDSFHFHFISFALMPRSPLSS